MRVSTVVAAVLAAAPAVVSAAGKLGYALGVKNPDGSCKETSDWEADLKAIKAETGSTVLRTYAAGECDVAERLLPVAKEEGMKVFMGIWPDTDESYAKDKAAIVKWAPKFKDQVYAITVGSETLYRKNFTGEQLLAKIKDVKSALPGFKVGTADSWNKFKDGTANPIIEGGVDILLCNAFSYWQGQKIDNATATFFDDIMQAFGHIQSIDSSGGDGIELWVGETGWPSAGDNYQDAVPSVANAARFFSEGFCGMVEWGFNAFFFEAFDEPWKPVSMGQDGHVADETHWGAMTADRKPKYSLKC